MNVINAEPSNAKLKLTGRQWIVNLPYRHMVLLYTTSNSDGILYTFQLEGDEYELVDVFVPTTTHRIFLEMEKDQVSFVEYDVR